MADMVYINLSTTRRTGSPRHNNDTRKNEESNIKNVHVLGEYLEDDEEFHDDTRITLRRRRRAGPGGAEEELSRK